MSRFLIAWRSIQQRGLASSLTAFNMAMGVMLVVIVLSIHGLVGESFRNNSSLGYNMVVGAKGGKLQLTLNTVYYLSQPVENISYDYYLEFLPQDRRRRELQNSIQSRAMLAQHQAAQSEALAAASLAGGGPSIAALAGMSAVHESGAPMKALAHPLITNAQQHELSREGKFAQFTRFAIPVCLGDYFGRFRVVGTTPEMFDVLKFGPENNQQYEFAQGRNFKTYDDEHGYFEAVVGAKVAREMQVKLGDQISPSHGDPEGTGHASKFTIVGILKSTGTPNDRAVFANIEGFYLMEDHAKPLDTGEEDQPPEEPPSDGDAAAEHAAAASEAELHDHDDDHAVEKPEPLPVEQREVTALLVRTISPLVTPGVQNTINEDKVQGAQAVLPVYEIYSLFSTIVGPIQTVLLVLTMVVCASAGISILVSIYNSMSDRRHEIAVMRALGADRWTVMTVILLESIYLSVGGGVAGWLVAHLLTWAASDMIEAQTGVTIRFWEMTSAEFMLIPALVMLAVVVGFLPAISAYRTDVAKSLGA